MKKSQTKPRYKTNWNLKLLYQSADDPQLQLDLEQYQKKRRIFAEKYQNRTDYLTDANQLLVALTEYEQLISDLNGGRPLIYFHYLTSINSNEPKFQAQLNKITHQLTKAQNELTFFPIQLGKIDQAKQDLFLKDNSLKRYHYLLQKRFEQAKFDLTEDQEKLLNLTHQTSYQMWVKGVEKAVNQLYVKLDNKQLPISEATNIISELPTKHRRGLHTKILNKLTQVEEFAETEINAVITHKTNEDELRGFTQPYQETILSFENDPEIVQVLIETVTKNFNLSHRFYQLKARILNQKKLTYADRSAKIETVGRKYSFAQAYDLVFTTLNQYDPEFGKILQKMAQDGQLDVFPKQNKVGGAYCSSSTNNPTFVLLNHTNDFNSTLTLAHELGHAIHSELSKKQPVIYQNYSPSTAETASTFFEQLVFEELVKDFSAEEKIVALHNRLQDDINTIFRQVAVFNFELELHQKIKKYGYLDSKQIGALLNQHMLTYLSDKFTLTEQDGLFYIIWPHLRFFFYTYAYAYGQLISKNLIYRVKENPNEVEAVKKFLSAGGSNKPVNIFKAIKIDLSQPNFFDKGLATIKKDLDELEKLI